MLMVDKEGNALNDINKGDFYDICSAHIGFP